MINSPTAMRFMLCLFLLALLIAVPGTRPGAVAQEMPSAPRSLAIGTKVAPPFAIKSKDGTWHGISIDLMSAIAARLGVTYELHEVTLAGMIEDVADGQLDASIAAITMTAEREQVIDFSYAYYRSSLGVAVAKSRSADLGVVWATVTSPDFLSIVCILLGLLFAVGTLTWAFERRHNAGQFEPDVRRGLFSGFWWAVVTMTTTGYGDKAPSTAGGRTVAILWMFSCLILTATFTAQLAASLTTHSLVSRVTSPFDLSRMRVGNVEGASSTEVMLALGAHPRGYPDVVAGLEAVTRNEIDAFVHDVPVLAWEIGKISGVALAPLRFAPQDYAIVLRQDAPMRERVNRALLDVLASDQWIAIQRRYLGDTQ